MNGSSGAIWHTSSSMVALSKPLSSWSELRQAGSNVWQLTNISSVEQKKTTSISSLPLSSFEDPTHTYSFEQIEMALWLVCDFDMHILTVPWSLRDFSKTRKCKFVYVQENSTTPLGYYETLETISAYL